MTTPESGVKKRVSRLLADHDVYYLMPVQTGIGSAGLDYHCVKKVQGFPLAFFVETKAFGKSLTQRQKDFVSVRDKKQGAKTFVIDCEYEVKRLEQWLQTLEQYGLIALIPGFSPESRTSLEAIRLSQMGKE